MDSLSADQLNGLLEELFAPWVRELDLQVTAADASGITVSMQPGDQLNRVGGIVSGQALMAAADTAMVLALFSAKGEAFPAATVDMNSSFLKPATNVTLHINASVIRMGKSIAFTRAEISSSADDKAVLSATATYALPAGR